MAQEVLTTQQDSLLQVMNDTAYWKSFELGEVVVKSNLPKTRVKGDAMRTMISGSILEKAGSATDALAKIPSLKAEKGNGVEVFGRGAAEVYINGRKVQDMNELDRLRSEDILHVDVVQNPGARYAASTKAVVRITTKRRQGEGFSFVENAGGMYRYGWAGTNNLDVNYRTGGLDITASIWAGSYGHNRGNQSNDITYAIGNDHYLGSSTQDAKNRWKGYSPQIQLNYMLNESHSFGAYYKWDHNTHNKRKGWFLMKNYKNGTPTEDMLSHLDGDGNSRKNIFNAYYNGKLGNLSIDWNVDGLFMNGTDYQTTIENTTYHDGKPQTQNNVSYSTPSSNDFWATKLILSYPVWQGNLSAGTEYSHTSRNSLYKLNSESAVAVTGSDTDIKESSTSAFLEYGRSFGRVFAQAGLRYEYLANDYYIFDKYDDEVSQSYGDWFPTLTLSYRTNSNVQLSISYRKDIDRPNYDNLSSSIIYINKYSYQSGNPYLKPVYTDNLVLNTAYKWMNASITYQRIKNDIVLQTEPYPGSADPMVSLIRPENSSDPYNRLMFILSGSPKIGIWHPMWQASLVLQNYKTLTLDGSMTTLNRPYIWAGWNNDFMLPHDWRINANVNLTSKGDYMTYRMIENTWNTSLGIQKDVNTRSLGKFTFDFRCYDPLNIQRTANIVYGIRQIESRSKAMRTFTLDITWRFNEAQKKYRGTGAGESQKKRM
ncbi:MAG: TonB-dependent receptor family protein [Prevotellaceae bacterium]|nr:TonB-dependent receptor family protein [Candidatus Minthosoma equi]